MNGYNGFDGKERLLAWDLQKMYKADGVMNWDKDCCSMCKQENMVVMPHLENYFEVEDYRALCVECHMNLHARYRMKRGWLRYLYLLREGYKPQAWRSVQEFFGSRKSKELFNISESLPIFDPSGVRKLEWFEELKPYVIDLRSELISVGYSEDHLKTELTSYRETRAGKMDSIIDE